MILIPKNHFQKFFINFEFRLNNRKPFKLEDHAITFPSKRSPLELVQMLISSTDTEFPHFNLGGPMKLSSSVENLIKQFTNFINEFSIQLLGFFDSSGNVSEANANLFGISPGKTAFQLGFLETSVSETSFPENDSWQQTQLPSYKKRDWETIKRSLSDYNLKVINHFSSLLKLSFE